MASDVLTSLSFTLLQAFLGALLSMLIGFAAAPGYAGLGKSKKWIRVCLIFPQIASSVFSVLSLLIFFKNFPFGLWGVVIGNVFINAGICIIILGEKWESIERDWSKLSEFLGAKSFFYFKNVVLPFLWPQVKAVFGIVFSFSLASLVIPLVLGGGPQASTLEVLIFEKIRAHADVKGALFVAGLQFILQFITFIILFKTLKLRKPKLKNTYVIIPFSLKTAVTLAIAIGLFIPYLSLIQMGLGQYHSYSSELLSSLGNSLFVAFSVAFLITFFTALWNVLGSNEKFIFVPSISHVIIGLGGFFLFAVNFAENKILLLSSLVLTHFLCFFPATLRFVSEPLHEISQRYGSALKVYGSKLFYSVQKVYLPLGRKFYFQAFLIAFCWSLGEYTVSAMVAPTNKTLPVYIQGLMGQYRLEEAAAASLVFFIVGILASYIGESVFDGKA